MIYLFSFMVCDFVTAVTVNISLFVRDTVSFDTQLPTFRMHLLLPSSGNKRGILITQKPTIWIYTVVRTPHLTLLLL
jgi:hypothetical protein